MLVTSSLPRRLTRTALAALAVLAFHPSFASAGAGDLDSGFGIGGVALFAPDDIDGQDAPLRQTDGRIVGAGLLQNASNRVFLSRLTADGVRDATYDSVHTGIVAPFRRGISGIDAADKVTIGGGSPSGGRITLERYTAAGRVDTTLGGNGRLTYDLPKASYTVATHLVPLAGGKTLISVASDSGGKTDFLLLRFTNTGLDTTFGSGGIARVNFGANTNASVNDFAILSNGKIVLAGSVQSGSNAGTANTALARLTPTGALDTSTPGFGSGGKVTLDASQNSTADGAEAIAGDDMGGVVVTGTTRGDGFVAKLTSTGAPDASFGLTGVARTLGGTSGALTPSDVQLSSGGILVTGRSAQPAGVSRWALLRLATTGSAPLDPTFGTAGRVFVPSCDNTLAMGATGLTVEPSGRILLLGSCGNARRAAVAAFYGTPALPGTTTFAVSHRTEAAGHERIRFSKIDPSTALRGSALLQGTALRGSALRGSALRGSALRGSALRGSALRGSALRGSPIPLSEATLTNGQTWDALLAGTMYADAPTQTVTLAQVYALDPLPSGVAALTLADVSFESTALRGSSLAAVLLNQVVLNKLPAPEGGFCALLAGQPKDCSNGVDLDKDTLFTLELAGDDLSAYYAKPISLAATDLGSGEDRATVATIDLRYVDWSATPAGTIPADQISSILSCGSSCSGTLADRQNADPENFTTADVGALVDLLPIPARDDITLGDLLLGLIPVSEIPFEDAPLASLLSQADIRSEDLQTYTTEFDVDCRQDTGLAVTAALAGDARIVPGSARRTVNGGAPTPVADPAVGSDGKATFALGDVCSSGVAHVVLTFDAEPGSTLGDDRSSVVVATPTEQQTASVPVTVDDSRDPSDTDPGTAGENGDTIYSGHISHADDIDLSAFDAPPVGSVVTVKLSHLPADYDLLVYGAPTGMAAGALRGSALRGSALRGSALRGSPVADTTDGIDPQVAQSETLQDITLRGLALRGSALRGSSINRGTSSESVTFVVRPEDAGKQFIVQVSGYNGAFSTKPYTRHRSIQAASPPKPCISRGRLRSGTPGAFPTLSAEQRESKTTLIVVNQERMAAIYGATATSGMRERLDALAAATDGIVVPVESHPSIDARAAFDAWDDAPCSTTAANNVVDTVNRIVDDVRKGMKDLRNVVLVGPDDAMPQGRLPDFAVVENESHFADEIAFGGKDTPVSRALRERNVLSDDPYGDFDPQLWNGTYLHVPDVALGRLIESPAEINAQIDRFLDPTVGRELNPRTSFVTGYDFLKDGAQSAFANLQPASPDGASSLISETWTAAQAAAGINRSSAGFTSVNAHYDHYRSQPAAQYNGTSPDLLRTSQIAPRPGSVAFTVGCHAGLNIENILAVGLDPQATKDDWAQAFTRANDLYMGNTGYGYGDTEAVAYSEFLTARVAFHLASGRVTAGQAQMFAKQDYAARIGFGDDYDLKALHIYTFYGLPMWKTKPGGAEAPGVVPTALPDEQNVTLRSETVRVQPSFTRVDSTRGSFWTADGQEPLVVQHRPIQPLTSVDVTPTDGLVVHGAMPVARSSTETGGIDPVFATPTVDNAATSPETTALGAIFPAGSQAVTRSATPTGIKDRLVVHAGHFRAEPGRRTGKQRLYTDQKFKVLRSDSSDFTPATITDVTSFLVGNGVTFSIDHRDQDVVGGSVMYLTDADGTWRNVALAPATANRTGGGDVLPAGATRVVEWLGCINDEAGNVSCMNDKGVGNRTETLTQTPGGARFAVSPAPPPSGFYADSPTISVEPNQAPAGTTYLYSVDGGPMTRYDGPFRIPEPDEGDHVLQLWGSDGSVAFVRIAIDARGPIGEGLATTSPNAAGWFNAQITVAFSCADDVSGVATCPADRQSSGEGSAVTVSGTATDRAGNSSTITGGPFKIDLTKPTVTGEPTTGAGTGGWYGAGAVRWTCTDALSGVKTCPADTPLTEEGDAVTVTSGTARDVAGNENTGTAGPFKVDRGKPTVAVTTTAPLLIAGQTVDGTAADTRSGVDRVVVTYTPVPLLPGLPPLGVLTEKEAQLMCNAQRTSCTWSAALAPVGQYQVSARAFDVAGNTETAQGGQTLTISEG